MHLVSSVPLRQHNTKKTTSFADLSHTREKHTSLSQRCIKTGSAAPEFTTITTLLNIQFKQLSRKSSVIGKKKFLFFYKSQQKVDTNCSRSTEHGIYTRIHINIYRRVAIVHYCTTAPKNSACEFHRTELKPRMKHIVVPGCTSALIVSSVCNGR